MFKTPVPLNVDAPDVPVVVNDVTKPPPPVSATHSKFPDAFFVNFVEFAAPAKSLGSCIWSFGKSLCKLLIVFYFFVVLNVAQLFFGFLSLSHCELQTAILCATLGNSSFAVKSTMHRLINSDFFRQFLVLVTAY
jgi:hypothetical protein